MSIIQIENFELVVKVNTQRKSKTNTDSEKGQANATNVTMYLLAQAI